MKKRLLAIATVAMIFAACSKNDAPDVPQVPDTPVEKDELADTPILFDASVATLVPRSGTTTERVETLGVTITNPANARYSYDNVKFVRAGAGTAFAVAEGETTPLWQNEKQAIDVSVYSPYTTADLTHGYPFSVVADQSTAEASQASDFVWAVATVDPGATPEATDLLRYDGDGKIAVDLQHAMCKLMINLRYGTALEQTADISFVAVKGVENSVLIDLATGTLSAPTASVRKDIIAHKEALANEGYLATYEAIFPPQHTTFDVMIELVDGRKFVHETLEFEFQSGYAYTLSLIVGKDKVELDKALSADKWQDAPAEDVWAQ